MSGERKGAKSSLMGRAREREGRERQRANEKEKERKEREEEGLRERKMAGREGRLRRGGSRQSSDF